MPFTRDEMDELNDAIDEAYGFVALPFTLMRPDKAASTIDPLYGEARGANKKTNDYDFHGSLVLKPRMKLLEKWGYSKDADLLISVTRKEIERMGVHPSYTDMIEYDGQKYYIKKVADDTVLPVDNDGAESSDYLAVVIIASTK